MLNWEQVERLAREGAKLQTITGVPFYVVRATDRAVTIEISTERSYGISRQNLERALALAAQGVEIKGPRDYRTKVADDRPSYAWAILQHLGYLS